MEGFQKIVLFSAIIILIIALVFIGISLSYATAQNWPPIVPSCPDYWEFDVSGNNSKCVNVKDLGTCPAASGKEHLEMDFSTTTYSGAQGDCNRYTWANNCGVTWDGITYGVSPPCQS
ncbi:MAG: hypothetical protein MUP82_00965 [Candidatus Marinimicrobia bacterium]|jgi:hypothetical protein|nr:hypothetical protein [Candidatus Neomarinimicrobiota bacterium]